MPGLLPGIHVLSVANAVKDVDGRDEPGHDGERVRSQISTTCPGCSAAKRSCGIFSCSSVACKATTGASIASSVHAHDGGIDHLHRRIMTGGQRVHDLVPDASPLPTNESIVTSGARAIGLRQVAP